jgi:hypothetical protein
MGCADTSTLFRTMKGRRRMRHSFPAAIGILVLSGISASAHHGHADFLLDQTVTVEGRLEELRYANPHVVLKIRTAEGVVYSAEWQAASWLQYHAHVMLTTLRVGDELVVSGAPSRDPAARELVRLKQVRRPRDGWTYRVIQEDSVEPSVKR